MAIILGSKNVKDLPENEKVAIGILLPIIKGSNGYFDQSFNTTDAVKTNIKNLLSTRRGERLMQPEFGTTLWNILFENDTDDENLEQEIETSIDTAIKNWLPYISIEQISINKDKPSNRDKYIFNVSVSFKIDGLQNLENVTFKIE